MFGANIAAPLITSGISALLSKAGTPSSQTQTQKKQQKLVDAILSSLEGNGPYSDLFSGNEAAFQKSFVEPAKARFNNQIAPQIQQSYIASGQQRGTGLDDQLLRAGVDLNSQLDQYAYQFEQDAQNRKQNAITGILNQSAGAPNDTSFGQDLMSSAGGYLSSPGFSDQFSNIFRNNPQMQQRQQTGGGQMRKGFAT